MNEPVAVNLDKTAVSAPRAYSNGVSTAGKTPLFRGSNEWLLPRLLSTGLLMLLALTILTLWAEMEAIGVLSGASSQMPWVIAIGIGCALPYLLIGACSWLFQWSMFGGFRFELSPPEQSPIPFLDGDKWQALAARVVGIWEYEAVRLLQNRKVASSHALLFGFIASATLGCCALILVPHMMVEHDYGSLWRCLVAITVVTATAFAFFISYGRILYRIAIRDAGTEIFSWATKNMIVTISSAMLFGTLVCSGMAQIVVPNDAKEGATQGAGKGESGRRPLPLGAAGYIIIGAGIAIIGDRAVRAVSDRAATLLGVPAAKPPENCDLQQLDGLSDEDITRLAEEGVDSLHALAFVPLPRLFFNTKYSLQRLIDWQDQALLLVYFGHAKAQLLRDHLLVRGAIDAQHVAWEFFRNGVSAANGDGAQIETDRQKIANLLGFTDYGQASFAFNQVASEELVNRLRVYWKAAQSVESVDTA